MRVGRIEERKETMLTDLGLHGMFLTDIHIHEECSEVLGPAIFISHGVILNTINCTVSKRL